MEWNPEQLAAWDQTYLWHPFTQMQEWLAQEPLIIAAGEGNYLIDAGNELEKLLQDNPEETRGHLSLAKLYADQLGRVDLARLHYRRVLEIDPKHPQAAAIRFWLAGRSN